MIGSSRCLLLLWLVGEMTLVLLFYRRSFENRSIPYPEDCDSRSLGSIPCCKTSNNLSRFPLQALSNITLFGSFSSGSMLEHSQLPLSAEVTEEVVPMPCFLVFTFWLNIFPFSVFFNGFLLLWRVVCSNCQKNYLAQKQILIWMGIVDLNYRLFRQWWWIRYGIDNK